ncbi:MAG: FIST C-terminal domain-containing protein [Phycisphaerae bacterium]|nr:FIST C-terminal domain-containing protein [Phycisphaerae bacterium]
MEHTSTATALSVGVGLSANVDAGLAAEQACEQAAAFVKPGEADLVLIFAAGAHAGELDDIAQVIRSTLEPGTLVGVSAEGIIANDAELERQPAVAVFAASLPGTSLHPFSYRDLPHVKDDDSESLREAARVAGARRDLRATLFFADPFSVPAAAAVSVLSNTRSVVEGLKRAPVIGGMASGASKPGGNTLVLNEQVMRAGGVGVAIRGDIAVDALVSQGCRPIGKPLVVTGAQRNIIKSLGGVKAMDALREIIGELEAEDRDLLTNGVFVGRVIDEYKSRFGRGDFLIRGVLGVDNSSGSIAVGDLVRTGQTIQFHLRDAKTATEDLELLLASQQLQTPPVGGLLFTCNGRGARLFGDANHDAARVSRTLGTDPERPMPLAGFFAAGEIGPIGESSFLHGHTASLALFRAKRRIHGES